MLGMIYADKLLEHTSTKPTSDTIHIELDTLDIRGSPSSSSRQAEFLQMAPHAICQKHVPS